MNRRCARVPRGRRRLLMVSCDGKLRTETDGKRLALTYSSWKAYCREHGGVTITHD